MPEVTAVLTGWAKCVTGRDELIAVTAEQRDELMKGALPCPACSKQCGPWFEPTPTNADVTVLSWRDGSWQRGFVLMDR